MKPTPPPPPSTQDQTALSRFADFLATIVAERGSDLHLACGRPPSWRINGRLAWPVAEIRKLLGVAA